MTCYPLLIHSHFDGLLPVPDSPFHASYSIIITVEKEFTHDPAV